MAVVSVAGPSIFDDVVAPTSANLDGWSFAQWRAAGRAKLTAQRQRIARPSRYYDGDFDSLAIIDTRDRQSFARLIRQAKANWSELVVNAVAERLAVVGFRFADQTVTDLAWQIWQANSMDADSELSQTDALVGGVALVLVQPDDTSPVGVTITAEHGSEAVVLYAPGSRRVRVAGYKEFVDDDLGIGCAVLILPDVIATWTWSGDVDPNATPDSLERNPLGVVGLVELVAQPRTVKPPRSELASVMPIQDRINATIFNRLVATDYAAFRQIYATGFKMNRDPATGKPVKPLDVGADRLLVNENPDGRFGVFAESTLAGYINAVEADVQHLAAITQTPPHYLLGAIVNASGDALKAAETGLVAKCKRRAAHLGEGWEEVVRLALTAVGNDGASDLSAEVIWRDFESRSEGETVDALVKMSTLGIPRPVLWQRWGASPQDVARWEEMTPDTVDESQATETT